jgi:AcrR family transcriptional regulator
VSEENTKEKILLTAGPMFAQSGYQAVTVRDICDQAGVNLASVNYYFGDKEHLYIEAVKLARESQNSQHPSYVPRMTGDPAQHLREFVRILLNRLGVAGQTSWQVQLLVREFMNPGEACRLMVESYFRPYFEMLLRIIEAIVGRPLPPDERLRIGFSIIGQCLFYRVSRPIISMFVSAEQFEQNFQIDVLAEHITNFSLNAIRSGSLENSEPKGETPIDVG